MKLTQQTLKQITTLLITTMLTLSTIGCSGDDGEPIKKSTKPAQKKTPKPSPTKKKTPKPKKEIINGYTLPPEPDPKINNATLLGVDSNKNGIRDDVERWVVKTLAHTKFRNNLYMTDLFMKRSKYEQQRLSHEDPTPQEVLKSYEKQEDDEECFVYIVNQKEMDEYEKLSQKFRDQVYNTHKRLKIYFRYEKRLPMREFYNYKPYGGNIIEIKAKEKACLEKYLNFKGAQK